MAERKFLIISIFVTLGAIAFLSGYLLMPEKVSNQTGSLIKRFNISEVSVSNTPKTLPLSSRKFVSFVAPGSERIIAVDKNGDIVEINTANLTEKTATNLTNYTGQTSVVEAVLSPTGNSIIYSFYDSGNNKKHVYLNFIKNESANIDANLKSAVFSSDGSQYAYLVSGSKASGSGEGELLISNGVNIVKRALKTRISAAVVAWPSDFISITSYDKDGYGDLFILKSDGALNKILSYQYDLNVRWSPSGEKVIFSAKSNNGHDQLFYLGVKNSGTVVNLDISTGASKCVWADEESVVCGLTTEVQFKDEFYKINVGDGSRVIVATPSTNLLTKELVLNHSGDTLFVLNDIDSKLYAFKIK